MKRTSRPGRDATARSLDDELTDLLRGAGAGGGAGHGPAPVNEKPKQKPAVEPPRSPDAPPTPGKTTGPISLSPAPGPLPDTAEELLAVIQKPATIAQALGAVQKLGALYGRDITEDMSVTELQEFHPLITAVGVGSNPESIKSFVLYAIPLRRALARSFPAKSADIGMMLDLVVVAYWKAVMAERASVVYLTAAIEKPHLVDKVPALERVKDLAVRQLVRLLEALRVATGRRLTLDPDADVAKLLRFPAELVDSRSRRAARG